MACNGHQSRHFFGQLASEWSADGPCYTANHFFDTELFVMEGETGPAMYMGTPGCTVRLWGGTPGCTVRLWGGTPGCTVRLWGGTPGCTVRLWGGTQASLNSLQTIPRRRIDFGTRYQEFTFPFLLLPFVVPQNFLCTSHFNTRADRGKEDSPPRSATNVVMDNGSLQTRHKRAHYKGPDNDAVQIGTTITWKTAASVVSVRSEGGSRTFRNVRTSTRRHVPQHRNVIVHLWVVIAVLTLCEISCGDVDV